MSSKLHGLVWEGCAFTGMILSRVNQIVDRRTASMRSVGMLTNLNHAAMSTLLGDRVMDRMTMNGGRWVNFNWESWRSNVGRQGM